MTATMRNDGGFLSSGTLSIFSKCLVQESDGTTSSLPTARGQHRAECLVGQIACALESGSCPCLADRFSYRGGEKGSSHMLTWQVLHKTLMV